MQVLEISRSNDATPTVTTEAEHWASKEVNSLLLEFPLRRAPKRHFKMPAPVCLLGSQVDATLDCVIKQPRFVALVVSASILLIAFAIAKIEFMLLLPTEGC